MTSPRSHRMSSLTWGIILAILASMIYGIYPAAAKKAEALGANPMFLALASTFLRSIFFMLFCLREKEKPFALKSHRKIALTSGLFQAISMLAVYSAISLMPGPLVLVVINTNSLLLLAYAVYKKETRFNRFDLLITLGTLVGLALALDVWSFQNELKWLGVTFAFISGLAIATRLHVNNNQMTTRSPAVVGAEGFVLAFLILLPVSYFYQLSLPTEIVGYAWVFLAALTLSVGSLLTFHALPKLGPFRLSLFMKVEPIFTALFAVLFLQEYLKFTQYLGIVGLIGLLMAYQYVSHKRAGKARKELVQEIERAGACQN